MYEEEISECRLFYNSNNDIPQIMRFEIKLDDLVDYNIFKKAVFITMKRYPYYCVKLEKKNDSYYFISNSNDIIVSNSNNYLKLNTEETNYHLLYFSSYDNIISINVFHVLTDGYGVYQIIKTLLFYYGINKYGNNISKEGIRLYGDVINEEEYMNPFINFNYNPKSQYRLDPVYTIKREKTSANIYHISIPEEKLMDKIKYYGGTPNVFFSILIAKAIYKIDRLDDEKIRISVCVNQRKGFNNPLLHQSLVGGAMLDFNKDNINLSMDELCKIMKKALKEKTTEEKILDGIASQRALAKYILSFKEDNERVNVVKGIYKYANEVVSANISYVGNTDFKEMESHIIDFKTLISPTTPILIEISSVNNYFYLDIIQDFDDDIYIKEILNELNNLGINYNLKNKAKLIIPSIKLPWN